MTGFGRGEVTRTSDRGDLSAVAEVRSVNSRFLETNVRLPRTMNERELEVRELVRKNLERGKVSVSSVSVTITKGDSAANVQLSVNEPVAKGYFELLDRLRTVTGINSEISIRDITSFSDVFTTDGAGADAAKNEWEVAQEAVLKGLQALNEMRRQEGGELEKDMRKRLEILTNNVAKVEELSKNTAQEEYNKVKERIIELTKDVNVLNNERLELEVALLAERLDITEEIVRFRSHMKFFLEALDAPEPAGRKLNFLLQEMNREINTMASKTNVPEVAHIVVGAKEELEKMREQVQNVE
jgi:uncharacterized protein (TIGR00255 family)